MFIWGLSGAGEPWPLSCSALPLTVTGGWALALQVAFSPCIVSVTSVCLIYSRISYQAHCSRRRSQPFAAFLTSLKQLESWISAMVRVFALSPRSYSRLPSAAGAPQSPEAGCCVVGFPGQLTLKKFPVFLFLLHV